MPSLTKVFLDLLDFEAWVAAQVAHRAELEEHAQLVRTEENDRMLAHQVSWDQYTHEFNDRLLALLIAGRECPCEEHDRLLAEEMERAPSHFMDVRLPNDEEIPKEDWEAMFGELSSGPPSTMRADNQNIDSGQITNSSQPSTRSVATQTAPSRTATAATQTSICKP